MYEIGRVPAFSAAVTGATGFTGGALARRLIADGHSLHVLARRPENLTLSADGDRLAVVQGDLLDRDALAKLVDGTDVVFHIAAMYRTEGEYADFLKVNYQGTVDLLAAAQAAGVRRFIHCSTIGVHGSVADTPADENAPLNPRDAYQETKVLAEEACRAAMRDGAMEIVIVRPCAIYGPGDLRMLKMFRLIERRTFFFAGDGTPNFHPVYIDDLIAGFLLAASVPGAAGETFLIGDERYMPLTEYVAAAAKAIGAPPPSIRLPYRPLEAVARVCEVVFPPFGLQPPLHRRRLTFFKHNRAFSIERARRILGYDPKIDLDEGFRRTVAWYRANGLLPDKS